MLVFAFMLMASAVSSAILSIYSRLEGESALLAAARGFAIGFATYTALLAVSFGSIALIIAAL